MTRGRRIILIAAAIVLTPIVLLAGLVLLVQSEWGERWAEKQVAERTHREVQLEGIRLRAAWPPIVTFERVRIGNPPWAKTPNLVDAEGLAARVEVWPLFARRIVVPYLEARKVEAGLELKGDQATWRFGQDERDPSRIDLDRVVLSDGHIVYRDENEDTALDVNAKGSLGETGEVRLTATGKVRGEPAKGEVTLPGLAAAATTSIRFAGNGTVGRTHAVAEGTFGTSFETFDFQLKLSGQTLKELHKVLGLVLPETPPYNLAGRLRHSGKEWVFDPFTGKVGDSDLRGNVTYLKGGPRPLFRANLESKLLDFDDLGPLIGAPPKTGPGETASPEQRAKAAQLAASSRVLPHQKFSTEHWSEMDADVHLVATKVQRPKQVPLDSLSTHLVLKDAVLHLDPLNFAAAGGRVTSKVVIDSHAKPPAGDIRADVQGLKLAQLFPTLKTMEDALGTMYGRAELKGRGASVGDLLGTSNGKVVLAANGGRVSDLLVQLLEIDVAHAAMLLGTRKTQVDLRCAVGTFAVKHGVAEPESFVVDTTETNVKVSGKIDLNQERFDLQTQGKGKSPSVLVVRSPIVMEGPLKKPSIHPKAGPIAVQVGAAAALAAVAPPLAIVPFLDAGTGKDADCDKLLADARGKGAEEKTKAASSGSPDPSDRASAAAPATPKRRKDVASAAGN
jgi:AsmA family protein